MTDHNPSIIDCETCGSLLPWYVSRRSEMLSDQEQAALSQHLSTCLTCQQELRDWQALSQLRVQQQAEINQGLRSGQILAFKDSWAALDLRLENEPQISAHQQSGWGTQVRERGEALADFIRIQVRVLRHELWGMPALLLLTPMLARYLLFYGATLLQQMEMAAFLSALATAFGMALLYGDQVDPAREMTLSTSTSPHLVLAFRLILFLGYTLLLNLLSLLGFALISQTGVLPLSWLLTHWFAPLCCLGAISLLLSTLLNARAAIGITAVLWLLRGLLPLSKIPDSGLTQAYKDFWHQGNLLWLVALGALLLTFMLLERKDFVTV